MSPSEQAAPGQLLEKLKSTLDDAKKNLGDNLGSEDMRKKLLSLAEETAVKLPASLIPFGIGKEPAEKLTRVLVDGAIKRVMSRGGSQDGQTTQSPAPDGKNPTISPQTSQVEPKASKPDDTGLKIEGASPLPIDSKIPIEEAQKVLRKLYNSHQRYVEQNPSSSKEDQKKSLDEELEDDLKLNKVIRPVLTPADRDWFHDQITAIVYGKSRIEPIRDEISKKLDEFDLDLLKSSVTDEAGRADGLLKKATEWLKVQKQIDRLLPQELEELKNLIGEAMKKPFGVAGGNTQTTVGGLLQLQNLITPQLTTPIMTTTGTPLIMVPGAWQPLHHHHWRGGRSSIVIRY